MIIIDLESAPAPDDVLARVKPEFKAPANYKDAEKIKAAVAEAETAWKDRAALSPLTGRILAIGLMDERWDTPVYILAESEAAMLANVWRHWNDGARFVGFNVKEFDFRFMVIRSRILGIPVPEDLFAGRYWNFMRIVDLMEVFCCFSRDTSGFSLDAICKACGLPGKLPGMTGADFARVFAQDREKALAYLRADLAATAALAARLGIQ